MQIAVTSCLESLFMQPPMSTQRLRAMTCRSPVDHWLAAAGTETRNEFFLLLRHGLHIDYCSRHGCSRVIRTSHTDVGCNRYMDIHTYTSVGSNALQK